MSSISKYQLEDQARDVDPDLRYMALEDFQKYLNDKAYTQTRDVTFFVPLLFQLLADPATEVQNQAVKSFAPTVRHAPDSLVSSIVTRLYEEAQKTANDSKFSTLVPTLALRSVFTESRARFNDTLAKDVLDVLLPQLLPVDTSIQAQEKMTIDKIEIFIDMVRALGRAFTLLQLSLTVLLLVSRAFREKGIIGKRAIIGVEACLHYVSTLSRAQRDLEVRFYDKIVQDIVAESQQTQLSPAAAEVCFTLFQVVLALANGHKAISDASINVIFQSISQVLKLDQLAGAVDAEDLDIDVMVQENMLRESSLVTLAGTFQCFTSEERFLESYASPVYQIIESFINYDPLLYQDSDDEDGSDADSELEFSDDDEIEQFENTGENDGLASRLRYLALSVAKSLLQHIPVALPEILSGTLTGFFIDRVGDRSDLVSNEAIATLVVILQLTHLLNTIGSRRRGSDVSMATESVDNLPHAVISKDYLGLIEEKIFSTLFTAKNIPRFSNTKLLIEALIEGFSEGLSTNFLPRLIEALSTFKLSLATVPEIVKTYNVIITSLEIEHLPSEVVKCIAEDLSHALFASSTYHSVVSDVLVICEALFREAPVTVENTAFLNSQFFPAIAQNLRKKQHSGEVRQNLLNTFAELIVNVELSPENLHETRDLLHESLTYEVAANFTIDSLVKVCEKKPEIFNSAKLCVAIFEKLIANLGSSDSSLHLCSLSLLTAILEKVSFQGPKDITESLKDVVCGLLISTIDLNLIAKAFNLLGQILPDSPADEEFIRKLITMVINVKLSDDDTIQSKSLDFLIRQIAAHNVLGSERLFSIAIDAVTPKRFISAKIMALICTACNLWEKIHQIEDDLFTCMQSSKDQNAVNRVIFNIHFLGCVSVTNELKRFNFEVFLEIARKEEDGHVQSAAARAMGLSIVRNLDSHLPALLTCYQQASSADDLSRVLFLVALRQILNETSLVNANIDTSNVWDSLIGALSGKGGHVTHREVTELKIVGDILGTITELDPNGDFQYKILSLVSQDVINEHLIYTLVVIMKQLVGQDIDSVEVQIIERITGYLAITNLELKLAIVSTLLTGIYNNSVAFGDLLSTVLLPAIFNELSAKEEFKKVIPMGPYKYVVDEGLEVRKLSYELVSAIINLKSSKGQDVPLAIDEVRVFEVLLEKGLKDQENEIIHSTINILLQILSMNEDVLNKISNQQEVIVSLTKLANRKLRNKASTQETESHEDTLRSVIKFSKVLNAIFLRDSSGVREWSTFYYELSNKHTLLFSAASN